MAINYKELRRASRKEKQEDLQITLLAIALLAGGMVVFHILIQLACWILVYIYKSIH